MGHLQFWTLSRKIGFTCNFKRVFCGFRVLEPVHGDSRKRQFSLIMEKKLASFKVRLCKIVYLVNESRHSGGNAQYQECCREKHKISVFMVRAHSDGPYVKDVTKTRQFFAFPFSNGSSEDFQFQLFLPTLLCTVSLKLMNF